jgi:hypothetical protein
MAFESLSDVEIKRLLEMPKRVTNPAARDNKIEGRLQKNYTVTGDDGEHNFQVYTRQNARQGMEDDFSCGLSWLAPNGETMTLCRYNGPHLDHLNRIEDEWLPAKCHIHTATERYIVAGLKPEGHALTTDRYRTLAGALHCLVTDCRISGLTTEPDQPTLFHTP